MHFGHYISGFAHLGLLTGLFIGPVFQKDVAPIAYSNVSLISEQDFIDLTASNISPLVSEKTSTFTPVDQNDDKLNFMFNEESKFLKSEGPEVVLDEPVEPVMKKPEIEIALSQKTPEISEELQPLASKMVNKLPDVQNEKTKFDKPSKVLTPNKISQPEIDLSQSLESATEPVDEQDIMEDHKKLSLIHI